MNCLLLPKTAIVVRWVGVSALAGVVYAAQVGLRFVHLPRGIRRRV